MRGGGGGGSACAAAAWRGATHQLLAPVTHGVFSVTLSPAPLPKASPQLPPPHLPPTAMMSASEGRAGGGMLKMRRSSATQSALTSPGSLASAASTSAGARSWIFRSLPRGGDRWGSWHWAGEAVVGAEQPAPAACPACPSCPAAAPAPYCSPPAPPTPAPPPHLTWWSASMKG